MGKLAFILFLFSSVSGIYSAEAASVTGAKIVDFGLYSYEGDDSGSGTCPVSEVRSERLTKTTNTIEANVGVTFGFRFKLYGSPPGEGVTLQFKGSGPKMKGFDAEGELGANEWEFTTAIDGIAFVGFTFDQEWELVPGEWTFQLLSEGRPVATKTFTVVRR